VTVARSPEAQRAAAVEHWWADVVEYGHEQTVLLAGRHADRRELNDLARGCMRDRGWLGERELEVAGRVFAEGDRVIALRNRRSLGLLNADRGTVVGVTEDRGLEVRLDDGRQAKVPVDYLEAGHLDLGYAMTVHKAQGATFERAHFLGDETVYRELAYTAATRGREETRFYVVAPDIDRALTSERADQLEDLASAIGDSRAKELALDVAQRAEAARDASQADLEQQAERVTPLLGEKRAEAGLQPTEDLERLAQAVADDQARLQATQERIAQRGWRGRRDRGLQETARVQAKALDYGQTRLAEARAQAEDYAARESDWWQRRSDALADAAAARRELDRRTREQAREAIQAAPYEPANYITELIGERDHARDVGAWNEAARRIETYHHTHQPDTTTLEPPGPTASMEQRDDWLDTGQAITRIVGNLDWERVLPTPIRGRDRDGPDLGMDMDMGF
jgi:hypothetical protein